MGYGVTKVVAASDSSVIFSGEAEPDGETAMGRGIEARGGRETTPSPI